MKILVNLLLILFLTTSPEAYAEVITYFTPYQAVDAHSYFLSWLDSATKSVRMCAYGFTDKEIADHLVALHNKGVSVSVVMDQSQSAGAYQIPIVKELRNAGIEVAIGHSEHGALVHSKFCIVDGIKVEDGSWNYTKSANMQDNTLNFIDDPERSLRFTAFWQQIHDHILGLK